MLFLAEVWQSQTEQQYPSLSRGDAFRGTLAGGVLPDGPISSRAFRQTLASGATPIIMRCD